MEPQQNKIDIHHRKYHLYSIAAGGTSVAEFGTEPWFAIIFHQSILFTYLGVWRKEDC